MNDNTSPGSSALWAGSFTSEEVLRLKRILLDDDKQEALLFLKQCLQPQLDQAGRGQMVRDFENR